MRYLLFTRVYSDPLEEAEEGGDAGARAGGSGSGAGPSSSGRQQKKQKAKVRRVGTGEGRLGEKGGAGRRQGGGREGAGGGAETGQGRGWPEVRDMGEGLWRQGCRRSAAGRGCRATTCRFPLHMQAHPEGTTSLCNGVRATPFAPDGMLRLPAASSRSPTPVPAPTQPHILLGRCRGRRALPLCTCGLRMSTSTRYGFREAVQQAVPTVQHMYASCRQRLLRGHAHAATTWLD